MPRLSRAPLVLALIPWLGACGASAAPPPRAGASTTPVAAPSCEFAAPEGVEAPPHEPTAEAATAFEQGTSATEAGDLDAAREAYANALRLDEAFGAAAYNLGVTLVRLERTDEAVVAFERAIAIDPRSIDALYNLGVVAYAHGDFDAALAAWQRARRLAPRELDLSKKIVQALHALDRFDEAEAERREVRRIRACSSDPAVRSMTAFVIDQREVGDEQVLVYEVFEPDPQWSVFYSFRVIDGERAVRAVQLESDPVTREHGVAALFGIAYPDDRHFTTRYRYETVPRYGDVRALALGLVRESAGRAPPSSTPPSHPPPSP